MTTDSKVGLCLAFGGTNYGALLQAYATQQILEDNGIRTEILTKSYTPFLWNLKWDFGIIPFLLEKIRLKKKRQKVKLDELHLSNINLRKKVSDEFRKNRLHNIVNYESYKALKAAASQFNAVLIGSDQMWVPGVCFGNFLSLRFVPDKVRKISYATSLGVSSYPSYCWNSSRTMWKRIDFLSVREEQAKKIIQEICGDIPVKIVVDPTYLIKKEDWDLKIPPQKMIDKEYVLLYFLGNDPEPILKAQEYAQHHGLIIISILSNESYSAIDTRIANKTIIGASPDDFLNWVRGASVVFTDSFHGLAFSIINEKQFFVFYRKRKDAAGSRNSRIDNIVDMWGVSFRLIKDTNQNLECVPTIDYTQVTSKVLNKREESLQFLIKALSF